MCISAVFRARELKLNFKHVSSSCIALQFLRKMMSMLFKKKGVLFWAGIVFYFIQKLGIIVVDFTMQITLILIWVWKLAGERPLYWHLGQHVLQKESCLFFFSLGNCSLGQAQSWEHNQGQKKKKITPMVYLSGCPAGHT